MRFSLWANIFKFWPKIKKINIFYEFWSVSVSFSHTSCSQNFGLICRIWKKIHDDVIYKQWVNFGENYFFLKNRNFQTFGVDPGQFPKSTCSYWRKELYLFITDNSKQKISAWRWCNKLRNVAIILLFGLFGHLAIHQFTNFWQNFFWFW